MEEILIGLVAKYPIVATVLSIIGLIRLLVKPIMEIIKAYVQFTPTKEDDSFVNKVISSSAYNKFLFVLDWLFSIKIKK